MRILFIADIHIKLGQKNVPRDWQTNRYHMLFEKIHNLEHRVEKVIFGGDIFDQSAPTIQEIALFMDYVHHSTIPHILYSGNHEVTTKKKSIFPYIERIINRSDYTIISDDEIVTLDDIDYIPYTQLNNIKSYKPQSKIVCTHVRGLIEPHVVPEIDLTLLDKWDVVLAGDLHAYSNSQRNILYPGSPVSINFHRKPITNGIIIFDTEDLTHTWIDLKLPQLIRKTVTKESEVVKTKFDHTIYEMEGSVLELSKVKNSLIDKKLSYRREDSRLELHKSMTIKDELELYWREELELTKNEISNLMVIYDNNNRIDME